VGTVEGALISYRAGRFRFERQSTQTPQTWLDGVVSSDSNSVVLASVHGWLFRGTRANGTNHWESLSPPEANPVLSLCADRQGTIWYRTRENVLGQIRSNQFVCVRVRAACVVRKSTPSSRIQRATSGSARKRNSRAGTARRLRTAPRRMAHRTWLCGKSPRAPMGRCGC